MKIYIKYTTNCDRPFTNSLLISFTDFYYLHEVVVTLETEKSLYDFTSNPIQIDAGKHLMRSCLFFLLSVLTLETRNLDP